VYYPTYATHTEIEITLKSGAKCTDYYLPVAVEVTDDVAVETVHTSPDELELAKFKRFFGREPDENDVAVIGEVVGFLDLLAVS
jgi:hypothetical protein